VAEEDTEFVSDQDDELVMDCEVDDDNVEEREGVSVTLLEYDADAEKDADIV
jgi:hypothetical protein